MRQASESLAGRVAYVNLEPIDALELPHQVGDTNRLWVRGGFPESVLASNDSASLEWRRDFIRSYLERDVPMFAPRMPAETIGRLWTMLAHAIYSLNTGENRKWPLRSSDRPRLRCCVVSISRVKFESEESYLVHGGDGTWPEADGVTAIGLVELMRKLST